MRNKSGKIAVIDIGSNSVRLFVFSLQGGSIEQIAAEKFFCGLGRDLGTTGKLNPESVLLTLDALSVFRAELQKHDIDREITIGTAALREAEDAGAFLQEVKSKTGFEIKTIEGEEEARLAALGILSQIPDAQGVVADFGGGSLELARIGEGEVREKLSLKLGAHYLKAMEDKKDTLGERLAGSLSDYPFFMRPPVLYLIGGSWRSLAKAFLDDDNVEGVRLDCNKLAEFCHSLERLPPEDIMARFDMERQRAEIMDVSALMLRKLVETLSPGALEVSTAGIRDGIAYDYILNTKD